MVKFFMNAAGCVVLSSLCICYLHAEDTPARKSVMFSGELEKNRDFIRALGSRFTFILKPIDHGWMIEIRDERGTQDISRLTTPWHFVPNPRYIEGWHFRNSDNSGPNAPGPKNVNAPQKIREFMFSPEVGKTIDGRDSNGKPNPKELERVAAYGQGKLTILDYRLTNLAKSDRADFEWIKFKVEISWPKDKTSPNK